MVKCRLLKGESARDSTIPDSIEAVLQKFEGVFEGQKVYLHQGGMIMPFCYGKGKISLICHPTGIPISRRNEIEKLVDDMLRTGIKRPSCSRTQAQSL